MNSSARNEKNGHSHDPAVELAILELLRSYDMRPGDTVDIYRMQDDIERKGFGIKQFSAGMVQLLTRGMLSMRNNLFCLTEAGFEVLKQG